MKRLIKHAFLFGLVAIPAMFFSGVEAAPLPPGNPLFFVQDGMRSIRRVFTFNPVAKAALEIRLVNERRADVDHALDLKQSDGVIRAALDAYRLELTLLEQYLKGSLDEKTLDGVAGIAIRHIQFFDDALSNERIAMNTDLRNVVEASKEDVVRIVRATFEGKNMFRGRIYGGLTSTLDPFKELRAGEALTVLEANTINQSFLKELAFAKEDMGFAFVGRFKRGDIVLEKIESLPGDLVIRFQVLDEVRERAGDVETRNALTMVRERILKKIENSRVLNAHTVRGILESAGILGNSLGRTGERYAYVFEQAEKFLADGAYVMAFQHAVVAQTAARGLFIDAQITNDDIKQEITILKKRYETVRVKSPILEKRISALADLTARVLVSEALAMIREIKLLLVLTNN